MKPQQRPFVVEVRQRRETAKRPSSIWGDVDLGALAAEVARSSQPDAESRHPEKLLDNGPVPARILQDVAAAAAPVAPIVEDAVSASDPVEEVVSPPEAETQGSPVVPATWTGRARRRHDDDTPLPRGQRWKDRLPKILR
jgi:hypothetical protein